MSGLGSGYQIGRHSGVCALSEKALETGDEYMATLCEREDDDGFERCDVCMEAWERGDRPQRLFSFWKTAIPDSDAPTRLFVDDDVLLSLFERLAEDERPQRAAFRFVLCLILMRKRLLRYIGRAGEGENERWLMRRRLSDPDDPPVEVVNPRLADDDVRDLTDQLSEVLQGEL